MIRYLVCGLTIFLGGLACAGNVPQNIPGEDATLALLLGQGVNTVDWTTKGFCVELGELQTQSRQSTGQYAEFRMLEISSESSLRQNLNISAAGMLKSSIFFKLDARTRFARSVNKNQFSRYLLVHVRVANQLELASSFTFKQNAIDLLTTGRMEDFIEFCGNEFIYGRRTGGELFALFEFEFHSKSKEQQFDLAVKSQGMNWRASAGIGHEMQAFDKFGKAQIKIYRLGGKGQFPHVDNLIDFGRKFSEFVDVLGKEFVTLEMISKDYSGVEPINLVTNSKMLLKQDQIIQQLALSRDAALETLNTIIYIKRNINKFVDVDASYLDKVERQVKEFINVNNSHVISCFQDIFAGCRVPDLPMPTLIVPARKLIGDRCPHGWLWSSTEQACCQTQKTVACQMHDRHQQRCLLFSLAKSVTKCREVT